MSQKQYIPLPQSVLHPYTGGHTVIRGSYIEELCPDHPSAKYYGFVLQHRLVVERALGRYLDRTESVHHIDRNSLNNDIGNLQVVSRSEHMRIHRALRHAEVYSPTTRESVRKALANGGLKAAARVIGRSTGTIRNQYPELVAPYKRKSPAKLDDPKWVGRLRVLAADNQVSYQDAAKDLGISAESICHILHREHIPWVRKSRKGEVHRTYTFRSRKPSQKRLAACE